MLKELGFGSAGKASAIDRLSALDSAQFGAVIVHSDTAAQLYAFRPGASLDQVARELGTINTARASGLDAAQLPAAPKPAQPFLSMELGSGDVTLGRPFTICNNGLCKVQLQKFNAYKWGAPVGAAACAASPCPSWMAQFLKNTPGAAGHPQVGFTTPGAAPPGLPAQAPPRQDLFQFNGEPAK